MEKIISKQVTTLNLSSDVVGLLRAHHENTGAPMSGIVDVCVRQVLGLSREGGPLARRQEKALKGKEGAVLRALEEWFNPLMGTGPISSLKVAQSAGYSLRETERVLHRLELFGHVQKHGEGFAPPDRMDRLLAHTLWAPLPRVRSFKLRSGEPYLPTEDELYKDGKPRWAYEVVLAAGRRGVELLVV